MTLSLIIEFVATKITPLLAALLGFGTLITVHEFGHFIFARAFGIKVPSFSIGMGPVIFKRNFYGTEFCLSLLPVGGYVEIAGVAEIGQGEQAHAELKGSESFNDKPFWQKLLVQFGGIIFNLAFAYLAYLFLFATGAPSSQLKSLEIKGFGSESIAEKQGLRLGDIIVGANGKNFTTTKNFSYEEFRNELKATTVTLDIKREDKEVNVTLHLPPIEENSGPRLGASLTQEVDPVTMAPLPFTTSCLRAYQATSAIIYGVGHAIKSMFVKRSLEGAGGPVMILNETFKTAQGGFKTLLVFLAFISINLALLNLLPLGALDGGQILFTLIEFIIRRPVPDMVRLVVNLSSWLFFISVALWLTFKDVLHLWGPSIMKLIGR